MTHKHRTRQKISTEMVQQLVDGTDKRGLALSLGNAFIYACLKICSEISDGMCNGKLTIDEFLDLLGEEASSAQDACAYVKTLLKDFDTSCEAIRQEIRQEARS